MITVPLPLLTMKYLAATFSGLLFLLTAVLAVPATGQIQWLSWEEAQARHAKEPRKLVVDVYTDWCGFCKKMEKATFQHPEISEYINRNFYPVKFNAEVREDITFKDRVFKYVRTISGGYHELASEITFGRLSFPTVVFFDENLNVIQPVPGFKDAGSFEKIMHFFGDDFYRKMPWKKYEMIYEEQISRKSGN